MYAPLSFELLGPLRVRRGADPVALGGAQRQAVMALLLLRHGETVTPASLIDAIWGEEPPATARTALQVHVSKLRKALTAVEPIAGAILTTHDGGYALEVEPEQVDAVRFNRLLEQGRDSLADGAPARARGVLDAALGLWRGVALEGLDVPGLPLGELLTLEERRAEARTLRIEADLALGRHREVGPELGELCLSHPLDERVAELHALALYRSGRPADALASIARLRRALSEELGMQPGEAISQLERRIVDTDPSLLFKDDEPAPAAPRETRRLVTALVCRLPAFSPDPEARRHRGAATAEVLPPIVSRLGGLVDESGSGQPAATFGVPQAHEDDAVRAIRAAWEIRAALGDGVRIGVATAEVLVRHDGAHAVLQTRDPVDAAEQLARLAEPGEILLHQATFRLTRHVAGAEPDEIVLLDERTSSTAFRLYELAPEGSGSRLRAPLVGRDRELDTLRRAFDETRDKRRVGLVTVLGSAGIGKSRLLETFAASIESEVVIGRCLAYGGDITFWPIAEIIRSIAGVGDDDSAVIVLGKVASLLADDEDAGFLAEQIGGVLGVAPSTPDAELFWAVRRFLEVAATQRPLVIAIEDLQWADDTLLDLLDYLATTGRTVPVLLVAVARPELVERRPSWGGRGEAAHVWLDALSDEVAGELLAHLLGHADLALEVRERIMAAAEGNPLFLEEVLSVLIDDGLLMHHDGRWQPMTDLSVVPLPPTIRALLEARLDALPAHERGVLESASIVGKEFTDRDLRELCPEDDEERLQEWCDSLVRKDLFALERYSRAGGRTYRFHHVLMRDAAYRAIPKARRAEEHERFGAAVQRRAGARLAEVEEIVGYHLESSVALRIELGIDATELATRAAEHLRAGGMRAMSRDDATAAASLFTRARRLLAPDHPSAAELALLEGIARYQLGRFAEAQRVLGVGLAAVDRSGDERWRWRLLLERAEIGLFHRPDEHSAEQTRTLARDAIEALHHLGDPVGVARAYRLLGDVLARVGRVEEATEAYRTGHRLASDAGDEREHTERPMMGAIHSGVPLARYLEDAEVHLRELPRPHPELLVRIGLGYAMLDRTDEARDRLARGVARAREVGGAFRLADAQVHEGAALLYLGDHDAAAAALGEAALTLEQIDERNVRSTSLALLAEARFRQGRLDDAERAATSSEHLAADDDAAAQMAWRGVRAKVLAAKGRFDEAIELAREGVRVADGSGFVAMAGQAHLDLAAVLRAAGSSRGADAERLAGLALLDRKGVVAGAARAEPVIQLDHRTVAIEHERDAVAGR